MRNILFIILVCLSVIGFSQSTFQVGIDKPDWAITHGTEGIVEAPNGDIYALLTVDGGIKDVRLIRMDKDGMILLDTIYDFTSSYEFAPRITLAHDGGVIVASTSYSYPIPDQDNLQDILVWKINPDGVIEWQEVYAARSFYDLIATSDGNYILFGSHYSETLDFYAIKINADGDVIWERILGHGIYGTEYIWETPTSIVEIDSMIYLCGIRKDILDTWLGTNGLMYQLDLDGNINWSLEIPATYENEKFPISEPFKFKGNHYFQIRNLSGFFRFSETTGEYWNLTDSLDFDTEANVQKSCEFHEELTAVVQDGSYYLQKHNQLDSAYYFKTLPFVGHFETFIATQDGGYAFITLEASSIFVTKTDCMGNLDFWSGECDSKIPEEKSLLVYPNPSQNEIYIEATFEFNEVYFYSLNGQYIRYENPCLCPRQIIDISNLAAGVYVVKIRGATNEAISKLVKL